MIVKCIDKDLYDENLTIGKNYKCYSKYVEINTPFKKQSIINLLNDNEKYSNSNKITIKMEPFSSKILKEN